MSVDVFHDPSKSIPKSDPRIITQEFDKQDIGARKSHLPRLGKNDLVIQHIKSK
jgi:hypothetical protein